MKDEGARTGLALLWMVIGFSFFLLGNCRVAPIEDDVKAVQTQVAAMATERSSK